MKHRAVPLVAALLTFVAPALAGEWTGVRNAQIGMSVSTEELAQWEAERPATAAKLGLTDIRYLTRDGRLVAIEMLTGATVQTQTFAKAIVRSWGQPAAQFDDGRVTRWMGSGHQLTLRLQQGGGATTRLEQRAPEPVVEAPSSSNEVEAPSSSNSDEVEEWADELHEQDLAREIQWEEELAAEQARVAEQEEFIEQAAQQAAEEAAHYRDEAWWYPYVPPILGQPNPNPPGPRPNPPPRPRPRGRP